MAGDAIALIGERLGVGLVSLVNIFNPEVAVIGGGVSAAGELLLEPARRIVRQRALAPGRDAVRIETTAFGPDAGLVGAALAAREGGGVARAGCRVTGGRLVVCPTPIGNLEDVTLRVLSALRDADVVACEDTRRTRVLLERYGVQASLISYHEHNERERAAELVERMRAGAVVALVSDAGMPLVSDPGYVLVQGCVAAGLEVEVLPGPSAALAALVASALPSDAWRFAGFLPRKRAALIEVLGSPETVVAFESPKRVAATLEVLAAVDPERPVAVCRELTKVHEEVVRGTAAELAERYAAGPPRGEVVLVVGGAPPAVRTRSRGGRRGAPAGGVGCSPAGRRERGGRAHRGRPPTPSTARWRSADARAGAPAHRHASLVQASARSWLSRRSRDSERALVGPMLPIGSPSRCPTSS